MRPTTLGARLLAGSISLVILFVVIAIAVLSRLLGAYGERQVGMALESARTSFLSHLDLGTRVLRDRLSFLASYPRLGAAVGTGDPATIADELRALAAEDPRSIVMVLLADGSGTVVCSHDAPEGDLAALAVGDGETMVEAVVVAGGRPYNVAARALLDGGRVGAVLALGEPIDAAAARRIAAATAHDVVLVHDGEILGEAAFGDGRSGLVRPQEQESLAAVRLQGAAVEERSVTLGARERRAIVLPLQGGECCAILSRDPGELESLLASARANLAVIGAVIALVGVLASLRVARRLARPLRDVTRGAEAMTAGLFHTQVPVQGDDEVAQLGRAFNHMAATIGGLMESLCQQAERAEAANRAKDAFLSSMSHELRTPITNVRAHAEILAVYGESASTEERAEFVDVILDQTARLEAMVGRVLDFAALAAEGTEAPGQSCDLVEAARTAVARLTPAAGGRHVDLVLEAPPAVAVRGSVGRLGQLVEHLVDNALAFSQPGARVEVRVEVTTEGPQVRVCDHGPGVPAADRERIFEPFFQASDYLTGKPPGVGLGLTFARAIAEAHGGCVWCEETPGGGATFVARVAGEVASRDVDAVASPLDAMVRSAVVPHAPV